MKKAGDLLSAIIDVNLAGKAREFSKLFSAWERLNKKHGIAAAAGHSRIQDLRHGILLIEADHPGWIQILQTKELALLSDLQGTFPELGINGIAFKLGQMSPGLTENAVEHKPAYPDDAEEQTGQKNFTDNGAKPDTASVLNRIKNEALKEKLKSLEKNIIEREKSKKIAASAKKA